MDEITAEELRTLLDAGHPLHFIDVREPWEYEEFNLGAKNIPLHELAGMLPSMPFEKDKLIVVHCQRGQRGQQAVALLKQVGYVQVRNLRGGIEAWTSCYGRHTPAR
ncbi:MAG: rhodanese-like domain-containing protein [Chitinophagales bacterium]|nr:rhodanese-like domain-containing protein [Chitinophagales bacterium]MDW8428180.1 rhodanese-like domain-containing protein [Chitinophagales bacterium]